MVVAGAKGGGNGEMWVHGYQFSSVAQSCPTLCDPIDYSTLGFPSATSGACPKSCSLSQ